MQEEAEITINGAKLTDSESMVRVAIASVKNELAEGLGKDVGIALTDRYNTSISRVQALLGNREPRRK
jgi:hypothetical protein